MPSDKNIRRSARIQSTPNKMEDDSSTDELVIDIPSPPSSTKTIKPASKRSLSSTSLSRGSSDKRQTPIKKRRKRTKSYSSTEEFEDPTFEETIQRCAAKNKLTPECVKKLLKKLVMNEHVLAIVKLKEEEEQRHEPYRTAPKDGSEGDDEDDEPNSIQPKLTRLKAKQLNKQPLPIAPLKAPIPDEEVAALVREELCSDEEDEEYKPNEDDIHSDDDPNTTVSDWESQPRTPATPAGVPSTEQEPGKDALYTKDGLFKIPRPHNDSLSQSEQEQENIALRTRSKLCLQTTAIETIESTFVPPDITTDMYDFDCDMDHAWKEFLDEFTKPLPNNAEDDDDTDPEYVAADKVPMDREELREVKVSKKELNDLVTELLEMSGIADDSFLDETFAGNTVTLNTGNQSKPSMNQGDEQNTVSAQQDITQNVPNTIQNENPVNPATTHNGGIRIEQTAATEQNAQNISPIPSGRQLNFQPNFISTPTTSSSSAQKILIVPTQSPIVLNSLPFVQEVPIAKNTGTLIVNSINNQPQYQPLNGEFFVKMSTPHESSFYKYTATAPPAYTQPTSVTPRERRYKYLHNLLPVAISFPADHVGFTEFQAQLLQQQLQIHTQLAAQSFMQSYAHPKFWDLANHFKKMLLELRDKVGANPAIKVCNLDAAVKCCLDWEEDLQKETAENKEMIEFLLKEEEKASTAKAECRYYQGHFPEKMMETVINSTAFIYPTLLPYTPFRMDRRYTNKAMITPAEERLIAFGLEKYFPVATKDLNKYKSGKQKEPSITQVCSYISRHLCTIHNSSKLHTYVISRRQQYMPFNPIKYYFKNGKAPPYQHVLEKLDLNNVIPPVQYQKNQLPYLWDRYVYSHARLAKIENSSNPSNKPKHKTKINKQAERHQSSPAISKIPISGTTNSDANLNITINLVLDTPGADNISSKDITKGFSNECLQVSNVTRSPKSKNNSLTDRISQFKEEITISQSKRQVDDYHIPNPAVCAVRKNAIDTACCTCKCHYHCLESSNITSDNALERGQRLLTDYFPTRRQGYKNQSLKNKLWSIYCKFANDFKSKIQLNLDVFKQIYNHFKLIEIFSYFLSDLKKVSTMYGPKTSEGESSKGSEVLTSNGTSRRIIKLDQTENKDAKYAYNFFEKVEETLLAENKIAQYELFLEILQTFNPNEDRVADLYSKIENLLIADHPELVDLFLTFLLPGQAAEVGKFFEHFILMNANDFLNKLNIYFAKQPSQIKKIYSCLNDLANECDVTMDHIKSRIIPLLKGNPLLIEWFLQLFPPENPPDGNLSDYEVISVKKLPLPDSSDPNHIYEDVPFVEIPPESQGESTVCGIKYIQGRIMYGTLPARLSFLANDSIARNQLHPGDSKASSLNGCVHNVRAIEKLKPANAEVEEKESDLSFEDSREETSSVLCDEATFKAHAIRLNPLVHGGKATNYADVAHLLVSDAVDTAAVDSITPSEEEKNASPKKCSIKGMSKKRINSPVNKKLMGTKGSPTSSKKISTSLPTDSKILSISKKLKTITESPSECSSESTSLSLASTLKRKPPSVACATSEREKSLKKPPSSDQSSDEKTEVAETKEVTNQTSWTRDEDKIILEEIKNGYSSVDELVQRIGTRIKNREISEIKGRYEFLMEVLKKFQKA